MLIIVSPEELPGRRLGSLISSVARSKQVCIEWMEATVLFCKDCLAEKGDLYSPGARLAFAGDALACLTRDALLALLGNALLAGSGRPCLRIATETRPTR